MPLFFPPNNRLTFSSGTAVTRNSANAAGDATAQTMATITIPPNAMGANGCVNLFTYWTYTNSANAKTIRARWGGTGGTLILSAAPTTTTSINMTKLVHNVNATNAQAFMTNSVASLGSASAGTPGTSAVDTTAAFTIILECLWAGATAAESITLASYLVDLTYAA